MVIARMRKMRKEAEKRNSLCFWSVYTKTETILLLICVRYGNKHCLTRISYLIGYFFHKPAIIRQSFVENFFMLVAIHHHMQERLVF